ncbi:DUF342 domain-containing protein [Sulfoacidibacillus thermotolerans]|uniref:Flagellar Assembly Protein A N-terminal region domain-containing protein n=1 Tax=Sulfoacidibacillus thermotolerans TaxID=1765684 RepID=A0A2U3DA95_SULT2|nr:FapA family protein [Sulfoacidibacillus thermotolerans]PWI58207.1 hypothetical protein BM613_04550 [Sulfoacidibacillus thermotolerans]
MANESPKLAEWVSFAVRDKGLTAVVSFREPPLAQEKSFTLEEFKALIEHQGFQYGVFADQELSAILDGWLQAMSDVPIAKGKPPEPSQDERLEFCFDTNPLPTPQLLENDRVDYRELGILQNAHQGQVLVRKIPGKWGEKGIDVYGNEVPSNPPKTKTLPAGQGTVIAPDGASLVSAIDGQIVYGRDQRVAVVPVHHVREDVDFSTGNIDFVGSVVVHGSVREGFTVKATGNIEVFGIVERANLLAGGDIIIRGGVQGSAKTRINAKGAIKALFVQNAVIEAEGPMVVSDSVMHSFLRAETLRVTGKRGLLVGGVTRVDHSVFARIIGSHLGTATRIEFVLLSEEKKQLTIHRTQLAKLEETLGKAEEALTKLHLIEERAGQLPLEQRQIRDRLLATRSAAYEERTTLQEEVQRLEAMLAQKTRVTIEVTAMMYPGVQLLHDHMEWHNNDFMSGCKLECTAEGWQRYV